MISARIQLRHSILCELCASVFQNCGLKHRGTEFTELSCKTKFGSPTTCSGDARKQEMDDWQPTIEGLIASGGKCVLSCTGGGSAIATLLGAPGVSSFLQEVRVPYSAGAMQNLLGREPDQSCSAETALAMACVSFHLADRQSGQPAHSVGVGVTAALASSRPKRGEHRCFIAVQTVTETRLLQVTFHKGARSRAAEDQLVGQLTLRTVAEAFDIGAPALALSESDIVSSQVTICPEPIHEVWLEQKPCVWRLPHGQFTHKLSQNPVGLLCGAFNPRHVGHDRLRAAAQRHLKGAVHFEMTINNADKPPLDFISLISRCDQFHDAPLLLSGAPTFAERVDLVRGVVFVVGIDTAVRIVEPRFYGGVEEMREALNRIRSAGSRFLVAGRLDGPSFQTLSASNIAAEFADLFEELPEASFREDISSSQIRAASG